MVWREPTRFFSKAEARHVPGRSATGRAAVLEHRAERRLVAAAAAREPWAFRLRGLRDLGRLPGNALSVGPLSLALLLARAVRRLAPRLVRAEAGLLSRLASLVAGPSSE